MSPFLFPPSRFSPFLPSPDMLLSRRATTLASRSLSTASSKGRVLLLYSGGLDTSVILRWLREENYEVVCYMADLGQNEDFDKAKAKGLTVGARAVHVRPQGEREGGSSCLMCVTVGGRRAPRLCGELCVPLHPGQRAV